MRHRLALIVTLISCGGHNNDVTPDTATCDTTAPEICGDGLDNNCDGNVDEGCAHAP
jgi:hypothetical protein